VVIGAVTTENPTTRPWLIRRRCGCVHRLKHDDYHNEETFLRTTHNKFWIPAKNISIYDFDDLFGPPNVLPFSRSS
jgi:hypothetical protein